MVKVQGLEAVMRRIREVSESVPSAVGEATEDLANEVLELANNNVPVATGALQASGYISRVSEHTSGREVVSVGYTAPHAPLVHTLHPTKAGWLRKAVDEVRNRAASEVAKKASKKVK